MSRFTERRPSASRVVALFALFVALSGSGVAVAAVVIPKGSVGNAQLKTNAITTSKIKAGGVTGSDIRTGAVSGSKVLDRSLTGTDVKDGSLLATDIKTGQIRQGARAYGTIQDDGTFIGTHPGLASVVETSAGIYCITPSAGVPALHNHALASVEWYNSSGSNLLVEPLDEPNSCATGKIEVRTYQTNGTGGVDIYGNVSFTILIP